MRTVERLKASNAPASCEGRNTTCSLPAAKCTPSALVQQVKGDKYSIGGIKDETTPYASHSFSFNSIQSFYIFSDGYADQFGGKTNKKFMLKNFQELLISVQHKTVKEQEEEIKKSFNQWKGPNEQIDDILVIGVNLNT